METADERSNLPVHLLLQGLIGGLLFGVPLCSHSRRNKVAKTKDLDRVKNFLLLMCPCSPKFENCAGRMHCIYRNRYT